jgi:hypothetical protein
VVNGNDGVGAPEFRVGADEKPARKCDRCGAEMKFIVALPRSGGLPTLNIFRCMSCDNNATEPVPRTVPCSATVRQRTQGGIVDGSPAAWAQKAPRAASKFAIFLRLDGVFGAQERVPKMADLQYQVE